MADTVAFHPISNIFPMLPNDALQELAEDIQKHGLLMPILLFEDKVLDGRNRARACEMVAAVARYEVFHGETTEEAVNYVLSTNLHRRHLTDQQKYRAVDKASKILKEKAKQRQKDGGAIGGKASPMAKVPVESTGTLEDKNDKTPHEGEVAYAIAKLLDVSPTKVYRMAKIEDEAPEPLRDAVSDGDISVDAAYTIITNMEQQELEKVIEDAEPNKLVDVVHTEVKKIRDKKKKKKAPRIHVENPFEGIDRIDMMMMRLQQYWGELTPGLRSEFLGWVDENKEQYPIGLHTEEVRTNGQE